MESHGNQEPRLIEQLFAERLTAHSSHGLRLAYAKIRLEEDPTCPFVMRLEGNRLLYHPEKAQRLDRSVLLGLMDAFVKPRVDTTVGGVFRQGNTYTVGNTTYTTGTFTLTNATTVRSVR
jgi:hypothetical protein